LSIPNAFGFNAQTDEYAGMIVAGIDDPAKVVRTALQDAALVAGLLITTQAMVAEAPKDKPACRWAVAAAWISDPTLSRANTERAALGPPFFVRNRCVIQLP
jgi:hypothetical protein